MELAERLLPNDMKDERLSKLFVHLCLATTATALIAAALTIAYGYPNLGLAIFAAAATFPIALLIMRYTKSAQAGGHYLAANIMLQTILFAAHPAVGTVALICMAAGVALLDKFGGRLWLGLIVTRCLYVAVTATTEPASATAAVAAVASLIVFLIVQLSERSRAQLSSRAERDAQVTAQRRAIVENLANTYFDAVVFVAGNDIFTASRSIQKLLGYHPQRFVEHSLTHYLHPDEPGLPEQLIPGAPPMRKEIRLRHADGRWVWVELYATSGVMVGFANRTIIVLRDYEKERKVGDQLTQAQRLESMGSMAAAVAHDFNNMLTVIMGISDELPDGHARNEIRRAASNAAALTNKLLTFGHGQRTSSEIHDVSHLMREQSMLLQHTLDSRYIVIESYVDEPLLVRIAESQFEQVVMNLVNNAREAMPDGGELEVSLQYVENEGDQDEDKQGHYAVLEVRDSGPGIEAETQAKIFDPFFTTKSSQANSGLGLSSCYGIVSQYGGFIEIDSRINVGASIRVYLPIAETRDHEPTLDVIDNEISVLVIDDDPGVVRVVRNALSRAGYSVRGFTDASAALDFFSAEKVSLVITDVVMPSISGAEIVRRLRDKAPALPVLFISGFTNDELDAWELDTHTSFLAKPFRGEEVVTRVQALLTTVRPKDELFG